MNNFKKLLLEYALVFLSIISFFVFGFIMSGFFNLIKAFINV
ncbi:hypothetical protein SAMN02745120_0150 [Acetoanaerobium noterae]|uniref:Uncharacterized protein n=1 Tax=Acetoanaerobium noterae TaxID=745369 RepID=A0A1T5DUZ5_9FIRM|nr:hypothetical protein SAMN02745120_0150 [Acetoanaerobium noterae]